MKKKTNVIDNIIWVLRSIFRFDHKYIFAMGTVTVITAICSPMSTLVSQSLMNSLQERRSLKMLLVLAAIYIGIDLFQMLIECFLDYYKYTFAQEYNLHLNQEVLKKSSRLNLKSFESSETYDMVSRAQYEADGKLLTYLDSLMGVFSSIITTVSYLLIIVRFRIWIMLCILIIPIVKFCINRKMNRETFKVIRERTNDSRKCWYMQHVLTYGEAYKELKIYNLFSHFIGRYREYKKQFNAEDLRLKKKSTVRLGGATVLETMIDGLIFAYIVFCGYTGEILIGNVVTYMKTITQVKTHVMSVLQIFSDMNQESMYIDQLKEYLDYPEEGIKGKEALMDIEEIECIEIRHLYYRYREDQDYVLRDINLPDFVMDELYLAKARYEETLKNDPNFNDNLDFVLFRDHGKAIARPYYYFKKVMKKCNIDHTKHVWHDLRHTYATLLDQNKMNMKVVSEILGHYSEAFTNEVYVIHEPQVVIYDTSEPMNE